MADLLKEDMKEEDSYPANTLPGPEPTEEEAAELADIHDYLDREFLPHEFELSAEPAELLPGFLWLGDGHHAQPTEVTGKYHFNAIANCAPKKIRLTLESYPEVPDMAYHIVDAEDSFEYDIINLHIESFCAFLNAAEREGRRCFVHCNMGMNRSATLCCAYLIREKGMPFTEAVHHVSSRRPVVLSNRYFRLRLLRFAKFVTGGKITEGLTEGAPQADVAGRAEGTGAAVEEGTSPSSCSSAKGASASCGDAAGESPADGLSSTAKMLPSGGAEAEREKMPPSGGADTFEHVQVPTKAPHLVGKKLLCLSDTHDFQQLMPHDLPRGCDILVHAGDFTVRGTREEVTNFRVWMEELLKEGVVQHVVCCAGNHELTFQPGYAKRDAVRKAQEATKQALMDVERLFYLEDTACEIQGIRFFGTPWTSPVTKGKMDWAFQQLDTAAGLGEKWQAIPKDIDVLVSHQPPEGQCDEVEPTPPKKKLTHAGSTTLRDRVREVNPLVHVFGHYHEGHGVSRMADRSTVFVNAAICDEDYQPVKLPIVVEFVAG